MPSCTPCFGTVPFIHVFDPIASPLIAVFWCMMTNFESIKNHVGGSEKVLPGPLPGPLASAASWNPMTTSVQL